MMIVGMNRTPIAPVGLVGVWINECFSEGRLRLASPDPTVDPLIDEDMVSDERDRVRMVDGVRRIIELVVSAMQDTPPPRSTGLRRRCHPSTQATRRCDVGQRVAVTRSTSAARRMGVGDGGGRR
jgi:hypothetical protein